MKDIRSKARSNNGDLEEVVLSTSKASSSSTSRNSKKSSTVLTSSDDPFAPREGKTLIWRNVNMTLVSLRSRLYPCFTGEPHPAPPPN